ncbi:S-adenosyl-L-methionine-dependent methyltransferase [Neoconidiobolus thromboides FSU 785]|nr:S-adenosyl-L-methionine-dependent methyltransferase [Neoconidiobolus thromboides FSU 785]
MPDLQILEFFSGIGGYRYALERTDLPFTIINSYDINEVANSSYNLTFNSKTSTKSITSLTIKDLQQDIVNTWLMSPPCQPFTRGGNKLGIKDNRSEPLLHLLNLLKEVRKKPTFFMLENVYGFETSSMRDKTIETLVEMGYLVKEYLLTPLQFGIPNDRLRYYCVAGWKGEGKGKVEEMVKVWNEVDVEELIGIPFKKDIDYNQLLDKLGCCRLNEGVIQEENNSKEEYFLKKELILKSKNFKFDIVNLFDRRSACFTKSYGSHHIYSSATLIDSTIRSEDQIQPYDFDNKSSLLHKNLRFFTPEEICLLSGIPTEKYKNSKLPWMRDNDRNRNRNRNNNRNNQNNTSNTPSTPHFIQFTESTSLLQKYRLLGNSINCVVVGELIQLNFQN